MVIWSRTNSCQKIRLTVTLNGTSVRLGTISRCFTKGFGLLPYKHIRNTRLHVVKGNYWFSPDSIRIGLYMIYIQCYISVSQMCSNFLPMIQVFALQEEKYIRQLYISNCETSSNSDDTWGNVCIWYCCYVFSAS